MVGESVQRVREGMRSRVLVIPFSSLLFSKPSLSRMFAGFVPIRRPGALTLVRGRAEGIIGTG